MATTTPNTAEKGAIQINNKDAIWRKLVPTTDNQTIISDSTLDKGAYWGNVNQGSLICNELVDTNTINGTVDDYYPAGGYTDFTTSVVLDCAGGTNNMTGLHRFGSGKPCYVILINDGAGKIVLKPLDAASLPANQFFLKTDLTIDQEEAAHLYYSHHLAKWCFVGGKH